MCLAASPRSSRQPNLPLALVAHATSGDRLGVQYVECADGTTLAPCLTHISKICRGIVRAPIFRTRDRRGPTARWRRSRLVPRYQRHRASGPHLRVCDRSTLQQMDRPATVAARRYGRNKYDPALRHSAHTHWLLSRAGDSIAARGRTLAAATAGFRGQGGHVGGVHADVFALCDAQPRNE